MSARLHRSLSSRSRSDVSIGGHERARINIDYFTRHMLLRRRPSMDRILARGSTALASTAVVTFALLYVIAPSSSAMTITARDGGNAPSGSVVLYGAVQNGSSPIEGARITVTSNSSQGTDKHGGRQGRVVAQESTDAQGTYRLQLYVSPGNYAVEVSLANGSLHREFHVQLSDSRSAATAASDASKGHSADLLTRRLIPSNQPSANGHKGEQGSGQSGADVQFGRGGFPPGDHFGIITGAQVLTLDPGVSYDVSAQLTTSNLLSFLPVSSY